jgi:para-nitrobenzyl esterase
LTQERIDVSHAHTSGDDARTTRRTVLKASALAGAAAIASQTVASQPAFAQEAAADPAHAGGSQGPVVATHLGRVRGLRSDGVEVFRGVPYGADTSGHARFAPPRQPTAWQGVRDATVFGPLAPQSGPPLWTDPVIGAYMTGGKAQALISGAFPMREDCLVLNVLTPKADRKGRPVVVYMHGGGYAQGSGSIEGQATRFPQENDVVFVTVNHRLNFFGYMYLGGLDARFRTGNPGMLDLILALQWVRRNIAAFGGDPGNVTIMGESGGGGKVLTLMGMPAAKGLFHRVIAESTSDPQPVTAAAATATTKAFMAAIGARTVDDLLRVDQETVLEALGSGPSGSFGPVLDGRTITEAIWADKAPEQAQDIDLIIGNTRVERTVFEGVADPSLFFIGWDDVVGRLVTATGKSAPALTTAVAVYRKAAPTASPSEVFFEIFSDFAAGSRGTGLAVLKSAQRARTYQYYFSYGTPLFAGLLSAFHTAELPLATRLVSVPETEGLSRQLAGAWAGFARTGDPNHSGPAAWKPYTTAAGAAHRRNTMVFDLTSAAHDNWRQAQHDAITALIQS